jgi:hypothetical protein
MSDFFFQIITDAVNYYDMEAMANYYALSLPDLKSWCLSHLEDHINNTFLIDSIMNDLFSRYSDFPLELWNYIQSKCAPESDDPDSENNM